LSSGTGGECSLLATIGTERLLGIYELPGKEVAPPLKLK
jgi:hypothetical protein